MHEFSGGVYGDIIAKMVVSEADIHNIMGGMESAGGVRLHNHKRKLKQRFDIIKKLGQGTYGKVQLGMNKETGQEVAIKTIKKCKIETEADLIRIRREIQIMSSVRHPNIIHIYEVFENREKMVLVMEYAAGGELYDYLNDRRVLTEQEARRIFRQISMAVFYCHNHKICHRDLKLENILLDVNGNAKIADFGLSNVFNEQKLLNTFCGSPLYASPEIVKGIPYQGPEVDCWSLGVLLYTLVYGAMPFDGSNFKRLVKQISQSDYFEPKKISAASPLIKDMLTVCPSQRANIRKICMHWWVNEKCEQNCLEIAETLAAQTPSHLDMLLSSESQSANDDKLFIGDDIDLQTSSQIMESIPSETLLPTRCHSFGNNMEIHHDSGSRKIQELSEKDTQILPSRTVPNQISYDNKRKLEKTLSMEKMTTTAAEVQDRIEKDRGSKEMDQRENKLIPKNHFESMSNTIIEPPIVTNQNAFMSHSIHTIINSNRKEKEPISGLELINLQGNGKTSIIPRVNSEDIKEGVDVGKAKFALDEKASLSLTSLPQTMKTSVSKFSINISSLNKETENEKLTNLNSKHKQEKLKEEKKRAINIISGVLAKPPLQRRMSGSTTISAHSTEFRKFGLKIPVGVNDIKNPLIKISNSTEAIIQIESNSKVLDKVVSELSTVSTSESFGSASESTKKCSKLEITLKSATLPRPRKISKAEIILSETRSGDIASSTNVLPNNTPFRSQTVCTRPSESVFSAALPLVCRSLSLEPDNRISSMKINPMLHNQLSQRSVSSSRQLINDSESSNSAIEIESIRENPREYIIPITVEDRSYITLERASIECENKINIPTSISTPRSRFGKLSRMGSLLSDANEDESHFLSIQRNSDDFIQRRMHQLRSSRPSRKTLEQTDSLSSGDDDDDDGFELLTAENLFSTLLSRVRSLTERLKVDRTGHEFSINKPFDRFESNYPSGFWGTDEQLPRSDPVGKHVNRCNNSKDRKDYI